MPGDWAGIEALVVNAALAGLRTGGDIVAERARQYAPVRHDTTGRRPVRFKKMAEVEADREIRRRLGLGREYVAAPRMRLRSKRGMTKAKIAMPVLRIGREAPNDGKGGTLLSTIHVLPETGEGSLYEVQVVAGGPKAPYAKFMEFGTRHNAAHPFLRPALHESRTPVRNAVKAAVRAALRGQEIEEDVGI